ncbi:DUF2344 domain-containing protein [Candidatus Saganbacteria bacterium]|nr:DUF2344 domain-containing protein [Candidatus Saganbacteria bacterium]
MFIVKIIYTKDESIKFISHLDLIRALERTIRRADLPILYSQGFNPRMKISYKTRALKVGETSDACEAELTFETQLELLKERLNEAAPKGIRILIIDGIKNL